MDGMDSTPKNESHLKAVLESVIDGIITIDEKGKVNTFNPGAENIFGYSASEIIGQNIRNLMPEPDRGAHDSYMKNYLQTGHAKIIGIGREITGLRKDGTTFPGDLAISEFWLGEERYFSGVVRDISDRKKAEKELVGAERRNQLILESAGEGIYGLDLNGYTMFANPAAEKMLGYKIEEMVGQTQHKLIHHTKIDGTPYPKEECHIYAAIKEGKTQLEFNEVFWRKDGTSFPVEYISTPIYEDGNITGAVVSFKDISERKKAEKALIDSQRRNQLILESAGEGIYGLDLNGYTMFANPAAEKMLGYKIEEMVGQTQHKLIHHTKIDGTPYPKEECHIYAAIKEGKTQLEFNEVFWRKDGTSFPVEYISTPIYEDGNITGAVVSFKDISERKKAEKEREELLESLQITNKELEQFAYIASHDLKSPLRAISSLTDWIKEDLGNIASDETRENLNLLIGRVKRMDSLINGILTYSKIGKKAPIYEDVNVNDLLSGVIDLIAPNHAKCIHIQENLLTLRTEKLKLEQVFANLISNAIRHCDKEVPEIQISMETIEGFLEFSVSDNGPGIDPKYHEKVFVMFQTLKSRDKAENTGIGLAIVKKLIDNIRGKIFIQSEIGQGTTVKFIWPNERVE